MQTHTHGLPSLLPLESHPSEPRFRATPCRYGRPIVTRMEPTRRDPPGGRPAGLNPAVKSATPIVHPPPDAAGVAAEPTPPRLLERLRQAIRVRHYLIRTESA